MEIASEERREISTSIHTSLCHIFFIANETHIDIQSCEVN